MQDTTYTPPNLREGIVEVYNKEELELLCTDLGVQYDYLPGDTLPNKVQNFIEYMKRRGKLPDLIMILKKERSHINWDAVAGGAGGQVSATPIHSSSTPYQWKWIAIASIVVLVVVGSVWSSLLLTPTSTANPIPNPDAPSLQTAIEYYEQGKKLSGEGDYDAAIEQFTQAITLNPEYAVAYNNRGWAYYEKGEYDRAIQDYDQAIALDENYKDAYYFRGFIYKLKGERDKAIADFRKYLELEDDPYWRQQAENYLRELGVTP